MMHIGRRGFMVGMGAFGLATTLPTRRASAQDKIILGDGAHKYEWQKDWLKLPDGVKLASTHGCVAVDSKDNIYFNTDNENAIIVVEPSGKYIKSMAKDFRGGAHGMTIAKEGDKEVLYLSHTGRHEVVKMTLEGEVLLSIPFPEKAGIYKDGDKPSNKKYLPTSVAVAPNGDIYVGDGYGMSWVHQWNSKGEYIRSWNGQDGEAGKFSTPHGVAIDLRGAEPRVIVADRGNHRIQVFTLEGKFISAHKDGLQSPCKVYLRGSDILIPDLAGWIAILDKDNKLVSRLGVASKNGGNFGAPVDQWKDGEFTAPHGAAWDSKGNAYVEDWNKTGRVTKLVRVQ